MIAEQTYVFPPVYKPKIAIFHATRACNNFSKQTKVFKTVKEFKVAQDPCYHYVYIYLKSMHDLRRLRPTANEIFMRMYSQTLFVSVITSYCSQLDSFVSCALERSEFP